MDFVTSDSLTAFMVVNRVAIQGIKQVRRPDVVAISTWSAVAVIELKKPG